MKGYNSSAFFKSDSPENYVGDNESKNDFILNYWSPGRRNLLVHRIIITANQINKRFQNPENEKITVERRTRIKPFSIDNLLDKKVYNEFYTLHDGPYDEEGPLDKVNLRAKLNQIWVKFSTRKQPFDDIRKYFGEKLALYFTWLGFYTTWLSIASIGGIIVVIYGLINAIFFNDNGWDGIDLVWDNALTVPYALIMAIWATCFLEVWKRVNEFIKYDWNVLEYEKEELPRPEFEGTILKRSPVTLKKEVHFPLEKKMQNIIISGVIVMVSIGIVVVTVGVLLYFPKRLIRLGMWSSVVTGFLNLATILILNVLYKSIAFRLTLFENHRTATQFEDALILKAYLFDFINFYSALIYILIDPQKDKGMTELTIQLAIILIGKQAYGQIQEVYIPWLMVFFNRKSPLSENEKRKNIYLSFRNKVPLWVQDDNLTESDGIKVEYEEMVIQFGFLALFGIAFPLAPMCAWINNITEIRSDAAKYVRTYKRPVAFQAQDIGMWEKILTVVSLLAVPANAIIIAFRSRWMSDQFEKYFEGDNDKILVARVVFILIFEHLVFLTKLIFACLIPDKPKDVKIAIDRENYLARVAIDHEPPAIDEYLPNNKDNEEIFTENGDLQIPVEYHIGEFPLSDTSDKEKKF